MRIAIAGAGAIGGYFGACLAAAGHDVVFLARGSQRDAMESRGLTVSGLEPQLHLDNPALFDSRMRREPAELVLVCTKRPDTDAVLRDASPIIDEQTIGLSLQNGIDAAGQIAPYFGTGNVLAGVSYIFVTIGEPGDIIMRAPMKRILLGEPAGMPTRRCRDILGALSVPGIEAELRDDMSAELWLKFCFVAPHAGAASYHRANVGEIRASRDARTMYQDLVAETVAVGRGLGARLGSDTEAAMMTLLDSVPSESRASMLVDLLRAKPLELDYLTGAVIRMGKKAGVPTPANSLVYEALHPLAEGAH